MPAKGYGKAASICEVCGARGRHGRSLEVSARANRRRRFICDDHKCRREWRRNSHLYIARWTQVERDRLIAEKGRQVVMPPPRAAEEEDEVGKRVSSEMKDYLLGRIWTQPSGVVGGRKGWISELAMDILSRRLPGMDYTPESLKVTLGAMARSGPPSPERLAELRAVVVKFDGRPHEFSIVPAPAERAVPDEAVRPVAPVVAQQRPPEAATGLIAAGSDELLSAIIRSQLNYLVRVGKHETLRAVHAMLHEEVQRA